MSVVAVLVLGGLAASCGEGRRDRLHKWRVHLSANVSASQAEAELYHIGADVYEDGDSGDPASIKTYVAATNAEARELARSIPWQLTKVADNAIPSGYSDLDGINARLRKYEEDHPGLAKVVDMTEMYGGAKTHEGRAIYGLKLSDNAEVVEDEPAVLVVGAHHCREIGSPEMVFGGIDLLLDGYAKSTWAKSFVDSHQIWFVPVVNVDGYVYTFTTDNMWRKNRRPLQTSCGVDLNRNYPAAGAALWQGTCSGSTTESSNTYRGLWPVSERESTMLVNFHFAERPVKVIDFHQSGREVLYGYQCHSLPEQIAAWTVRQAEQLAEKANYRLRLPSADGEHPQHANGVSTDYAFLIEVTTSFQPPYPDVLSEVERVKPLLAHYFATPISVQGHVRTSSGVPIGGARVQIDGIEYQNGETRNTDGRYGRYGLWIPDGTWTLRFSAPGRSTLTREVAVEEGVTLTVDVTM